MASGIRFGDKYIESAEIPRGLLMVLLDVLLSLVYTLLSNEMELSWSTITVFTIMLFVLGAAGFSLKCIHEIEGFSRSFWLLVAWVCTPIFLWWGGKLLTWLNLPTLGGIVQTSRYGIAVLLLIGCGALALLHDRTDPNGDPSPN